MRPVMPVAELRAHTTILRVGDRFNERERLAEWIAWGYTIEPLVEQPGQLSRRGGIIDIYSPTMDGPVRIELFGDEIESIRRFDPATQRSSGRVDRVADHPARRTATVACGRRCAALDDIDLDGPAAGDHRGVGAASCHTGARRCAAAR